MAYAGTTRVSILFKCLGKAERENFATNHIRIRGSSRFLIMWTMTQMYVTFIYFSENFTILCFKLEGWFEWKELKSADFDLNFVSRELGGSGTCSFFPLIVDPPYSEILRRQKIWSHL